MHDLLQHFLQSTFVFLSVLDKPIWVIDLTYRDKMMTFFMLYTSISSLT